MTPLFPSLLAIAFVLGVPTLSAADISWSSDSDSKLRFIHCDSEAGLACIRSEKALTTRLAQSSEQVALSRFWDTHHTTQRKYKQFLLYPYDIKGVSAVKLRIKNPLLGDTSSTKKAEYRQWYQYPIVHLTSEQSAYESRLDLMQQSANEFIRGRFANENIQENYESMLADIYRLQTIVKME